jgi:uncharacterized protein (TIGR03435 family)
MRLVIAILILTAPLAFAQTLPTCASPTLAAFDVASVKPSQIAYYSSRGDASADSISNSGTALSMIGFAYGVRDFQITGGPKWLGNDTWDVIAKVDQPTSNWSGLRSDQRRVIRQQRLQAVLAQRFALKCHFETKELPVYDLVLAKGGSRLAPAADPAKRASIDWDGDRENVMVGKSADLISLVNELSLILGRTVVDKTGLTGVYDLKLIWTSQNDAGSAASASEPSGPTIFTALEDQLGLKLEPAKGPVPVLVIDSIDRPTEN